MTFEEKFWKTWSPYFVLLISFAVYFFTMSRGVLPIDSGELAASQYHFGIAHPTGYPLFNFIGFIWSKIPIGTVIFRLNLLTLIFVSFGNFFIYKAGIKLLENVWKVKTTAIYIASFIAVFILAFGRIYWYQSTGVEVYSLHILTLSIFFYYTIQFYFSDKPRLKDYIRLGVVIGFCFSNHLTSVLILPALGVLYFSKLGFNTAAYKNLAIMIGGFASVLFVFYGLMMVRANADAYINTGNPSTWDYFYRHVTGWQYKVFMKVTKKESQATLNLFFKTLPESINYGGILLAILGIYQLFAKKMWLGIAFILVVISTIIYSMNYSIHDIENYFLLAHIAITFFVSIGIYLTFTYIKSIQEKPYILLVLLIIPAYSVVSNFEKVNQRNNFMIDDYVKNALLSVDKNAIIFSREWDEFVGPSYYYQFVEKTRPDVVVVDKEYLRRSWYFHQLKTWDEAFASKFESEANAFIEQVTPFENDQKYDTQQLPYTFSKYISAILNQYKERPVYISSIVLDADVARQSEVFLPTNTMLVPESYFYRIQPLDTVNYYPLPKEFNSDIRFNGNKDDKFEKRIMNYCMSVWSQRIVYEMSFGKTENAQSIFDKMKVINPEIPTPVGLK